MIRNSVSISQASQQNVAELDEVHKQSSSYHKGSRGTVVAPPEFRFIYPEFLPDPKIEWRNRLREKLERIDMLQRRSAIDIPEFYTGKQYFIILNSITVLSFIIYPYRFNISCQCC